MYQGPRLCARLPVAPCPECGHMDARSAGLTETFGELVGSFPQLLSLPRDFRAGCCVCNPPPTIPPGMGWGGLGGRGSSEPVGGGWAEHVLGAPRDHPGRRCPLGYGVEPGFSLCSSASVLFNLASSSLVGAWWL